MRLPNLPAWVYPTLAGLLTVVFLFTIFTESSQKSPSSDEPPHIASGLAYVAKGNFRGNPQHPPLIKELSGLSLLLGGIAWPVNPETERFLHGEIRKGEQPEWAIGNKLIADNGPDRVLLWARLPVMLLTATLPLGLYLLGSQLFSPLAGLAAAFLCTMSPTVVGHAFLVTTDVGLATFTVWFLVAVWRYLEQPAYPRLALSGVLLGLAMAAKFSAVFLLPVVVILLVAAHQSPATTAVPTVDRNDPCPCGSGKKYKNCHILAASQNATDWGAAIKSAAVPAAILFAIAFVIIQITYASFDPLVYYRGLMKVNADHNPNYQVILGSELSRRFFTYFPAAWLLKEPIASILFTLAGLFFIWRSSEMTRRARLFLLLPPAVILTVHALLADNLGIRYVMSVFPFAHLAGGYGLVSLAARSTLPRAACCLLCLWLSSASLGIYPDHLSYFNEAACLASTPSRIGIDGGSRCGVEWLDDSNVDWGQGLKQLKTWLDTNAAGRPVYLANPFRFPATAYGIQAQNVSPDDLLSGPQPGIYAISAHLVSRLPLLDSRLNWLRSTPPRAIVGHGIFVYDFAAR